MKLVKYNWVDHRTVYLLEDRYRKVWHIKDKEIARKYELQLYGMWPKNHLMLDPVPQEFIQTYRRVWMAELETRLVKHVYIMNQIRPGYILDYGVRPEGIFLEVKLVPGVPAQDLKLTDDFRQRILEFCLDNIRSTQPYAHGDWHLSNILVNGSDMDIVDWDTVGTYSSREVHAKLTKDLQSYFGQDFVVPPTVLGSA